jgi:crossover junction endodeoxyribonuclease RusA
MSAITFELPFPAKVLWPNGRAKHWAERHRAVASHRDMAVWATKAARAPKADPNGRVSLAVTVHPKTRHPIDRDNCVSSLKSYLDGIADALGVDDRIFDTPTITFADPVKGGLLALTLTYSPA